MQPLKICQKIIKHGKNWYSDVTITLKKFIRLYA
jgi:hypothetical protein